SAGWERGTSVSKAWDQATTDAALETAGDVVAHLEELSGTREGAADRGQRLREFARRFAERAFRRPLTDEQKQFFVDRQFERVPHPEIAIKRVVLLVLKSPQFLYPNLDAALDNYGVASRLSLGLGDTLPDPELSQAAAESRLSQRDQVVQQAERMTASPP